MDLFDLLDTAAGRTIAYLTAAGLILAVLRWGWRFSRRLHQLADAFLGSPDPDPAKHRPGLPERVAAIEDQVAKVDKELRPNGGTSLRDAVDATNAGLTAVDEKLGTHLAEHARGPVTVNVGQQSDR